MTGFSSGKGQPAGFLPVPVYPGSAHVFLIEPFCRRKGSEQSDTLWEGLPRKPPSQTSSLCCPSCALLTAFPFSYCRSDVGGREAPTRMSEQKEVQRSQCLWAHSALGHPPLFLAFPGPFARSSWPVWGCCGLLVPECCPSLTEGWDVILWVCLTTRGNMSPSKLRLKVCLEAKVQEAQGQPGQQDLITLNPSQRTPASPGKGKQTGDPHCGGYLFLDPLRQPGFFSIVQQYKGSGWVKLRGAPCPGNPSWLKAVYPSHTELGACGADEEAGSWFCPSWLAFQEQPLGLFPHHQLSGVGPG